MRRLLPLQRIQLPSSGRNSNWPIVELAHEGADSLIDCLRRTFITFGLPDELASDRSPDFTSTSKWLGIHHRFSSVAFPHSNCRAEVGVKTIKCLKIYYSKPDGCLVTDSFKRAILQYRSTSDRDTKLFPDLCVFGRPIWDFIPIQPRHYQPHNIWRDTLTLCEAALRPRHMNEAEKLEQHTKRLPALRVGDHARV